MNCPNCLEELNSPVTTNLTHVLCNGRGEHITSALPMEKAERAELLKVMDRVGDRHALDSALRVLEATEDMCTDESEQATDKPTSDHWKSKATGIRFSIDTINALVPKPKEDQ